VHPDQLRSQSDSASSDENTEKKLRDEMTLQSDAFSHIGGLKKFKS